MFAIAILRISPARRLLVYGVSYFVFSHDRRVEGVARENTSSNALSFKGKYLCVCVNEKYIKVNSINYVRHAKEVNTLERSLGVNELTCFIINNKIDWKI